MGHLDQRRGVSSYGTHNTHVYSNSSRIHRSFDPNGRRRSRGPRRGSRGGPEEDPEENPEEKPEEDPKEHGAMHLGDGRVPVARDDHFKYVPIGFDRIEDSKASSSSPEYYPGLYYD